MALARDDTRRKALFAAACAALTISGQIAGKAARDAIFLGQFHVTKLPALLVVSSIISIGAAVAIARAMAWRSPARLIPRINIASAALLLVEWWLLRHIPGPAAIAVYIHQSVLGAILVSGFWSVIGETFDPRTARRVMGTVGAGATLGGIIGAVIAERAAVVLGTNGVLPVLAVVQLAAAWGLVVLAGPAAPSPAPAAAAAAPPAVADTLRNVVRVALLRQLATLVVLGTIAAAMLDYVFKARASAAFSGADLLRFFAAFYGGVGVITALVQWTVGRVALERWGVARTIGALPAAVAAFGAAALAIPGLASTVAARASENALRNSLYRQAYEALYTPLPSRERRSTKTVVDVGVERVGDALGGALVALALLAGAAAAFVLLAGAVALSLAGVWVAGRVQASYVDALERGLRARAIELDLDEVRDRTGRTLVETMHRVIPLESSVGALPRVPGPPAEPPPARAAPAELDPVLARAAALRSGDAARVRAALAGTPLPAALAAHAIPLLAWDDVAGEATRALSTIAPRVVGQLVDALLDADEEFAVRRRLPRVLATANGPRAGQGLLMGLADRRFEVRFRCARALARLHHREPDLAIDDERVFAAVQRELAVDEQTWKHLSVLDEDRDVDASGDTPLVAEVLRDRADRGLEHVFTLLALVLPAEPIRIAFRALHTADKGLRGTALEYLEQVLPAPVREKLWPRIEAEALPRPEPRPRAQVVSALLESRAAVNMSLEALRRPG